MKLTNRRQPKGKHNRNDNDTEKGVRISYCFAKDFFWKENIPTSRMRSPSLRWERRTMAKVSGGFLEEDEGEADSAKSEMMIASSDQLTAGRWVFVI
jgi:hypothetical protein